MSSSSIVFVDSRVSNYQSLFDSLTEPYDVFVLDGDKDGLDQMATPNPLKSLFQEPK